MLCETTKRTGEDSRPLVAEGLVGSEHVGDFTSSDSDVSSGNISVGACKMRGKVSSGEDGDDKNRSETYRCGGRAPS